MILCTGGESCGTRLATRVVRSMGGEAIHCSFPHAREWPDLSLLEFDAAIVMTRAWWAVIPSQIVARHVRSEVEAERNLHRAYEEIPAQLNALGKPWRLVSYESLITDGEATMAALGEWLDLPEEPFVLRDENRKWHPCSSAS